uniref:Uncharacterized protein n=1 Tax=Moniliophthora roreri TaxID=221103 RepID=A0A0W0FRJ8_MONRR
MSHRLIGAQLRNWITFPLLMGSSRLALQPEEYESDESGEVEDDVPGESECESDSMDVDHNNSSITTSPTPADGSTSNASPRPTDNHPVTSNATVAIPGDNQISGRPSRLRRGRNIV